jgi:hypothetical protein
MTIENARLLLSKASKDGALQLRLESLTAEDFSKLTIASEMQCNKEEYLQATQELGQLLDEELSEVVGGVSYAGEKKNTSDGLAVVGGLDGLASSVEDMLG